MLEQHKFNVAAWNFDSLLSSTGWPCYACGMFANRGKWLKTLMVSCVWLTGPLIFKPSGVAISCLAMSFSHHPGTSFVSVLQKTSEFYIEPVGEVRRLNRVEFS